MKVQIAFDLNANGVGPFFTLDDPVKGLLNSVEFILAGADVLVDVTDTVRQVSIKRGRNRQLEKFTAGNANIVLDNRDRIYDPLNTASPYFGSIVPRKQVTISDFGVTIYTGQVADWNFDYQVSGDSTAQVSCVDGLTLLVDPILTAGTGTAELTGTRVNKVLTDAGWPFAKRDISVGQATLDADVIVADSVTALEYLNKISISEPGALFVGASGNLIFRDRVDLQNASGNMVFGTGGIAFDNISVEYGIEEMANFVSLTYYSGAAIGGTVTASDLASIEAYGIFDPNNGGSYNTLLGSSEDAQVLANWLVSLYAQPQYRIDQVGMNLGSMSVSDQERVLALELGDVATVTWTPNNVGDVLSQTVSIDAIEFSASPSGRRIGFTMSQTQAALVLDDLLVGILNTNRLGF